MPKCIPAAPPCRLGPACPSDIRRDSGSRHGQLCADTGAVPMLCRPAAVLLGHSAAGHPLGSGTRKQEPGLYPDRNPPPQLLPLRHLWSSPYLSIFRDPPP